MSKYKSKYWWYSQWGSQSWWWWGSWSPSWWWFNIESIEEKLKRKKDIMKAIDDFWRKNWVIMKWSIGYFPTVERNGWVYSITVPNNSGYLKSISSLAEKFHLWKKFATSRYMNGNRAIISEIISKRLSNSIRSLFVRCWLSDSEVIDRHDRMMKYLDSQFISESDYKEMEKLIPPKKLEEIEARSWRSAMSFVSKWTVNRLDNKIHISAPPDKWRKEPSILRWKRINRWYINHTDYRPLIHKNIDKKSKMSILILIDWSGSMWCRNSNKNTYYEEAVNFATDLYSTNMFDVRVIYSESSSAYFITHHIDELSTSISAVMPREWWWEGFEYLTDRLWSIERNEDYVLVFTDMEVPTDAEDNLKMFIWWKKHMVLSFGEQRQFENLNVRYVQEHKDMMNVITTMLWHK